MTPFSRLRSIIRPPSLTAVPAVLCAPPRTAISSSCALAKAIAATTSAVEAHLAMTDGRRSISAFHTFRASS